MDKFLSLYYSQHEAKLCNKIISIVSGILLFIVLIIWMIRPLLIADFPIWIYSLFIFIPAFILLFYFIIKFNPAFKNISQEEMRSFSAFSAIVLITNIIQFIAFRADYWLISIYYDHVISRSVCTGIEICTAVMDHSGDTCGVDNSSFEK